MQQPAEPHTHITPSGEEVACYHSDESLVKTIGRKVFTSWQFWLGMTINFPLEHFLWTKVWPFYELSSFLGLMDH